MKYIPLNLAFNSRKLNYSCMERRPHMPNMDEILSQTSTEKRRVKNEPLLLSTIDFDHACGQLSIWTNFKTPDTERARENPSFLSNKQPSWDKK